MRIMDGYVCRSMRGFWAAPGADEQAEAMALDVAIYSAATDGERGVSLPRELETRWDLSTGRPAACYLVYALVDPRDRKPRYIGRTRDPQARYYSHVSLCNPARRPDNERKDAWIRELAAAGMRPELIVLETCRLRDAPRVERKWIVRHRAAGLLFNGKRPSLTKLVRVSMLKKQWLR